MVHRDRTHIDELGQVVLVGYVIAVPGDDIEGGVLLLAHKELAAQLVDNLPWLFLDLIFGYRVQEVSGVSKAVGAQGSKFGELEVGAPDLYSKSALHIIAYKWK